MSVSMEKTDFTRFFWLSDPKNPESEFQVFRFKMVLFGSTSSPFMLNATLHHHLERYSTPVAKDIRDNMYVDNVISGCDQETDIISYYQESRSIMNAANFNLRSWASNSPQLRERAGQDQTADTSTVVNILGLRWHPAQDTFYIAPKEMVPPSSQPTSKRDVLQLASKTYDPLGFISPVIVKAKLFIQELWQRKLEWDEPLPTELETKWNDIARDIQEASKLVLPRCFFSQVQSKAQPVYLHVFADASPKAYGATAYISNGDQSSLVMSKSRVAPLKKLTLPQLELMAASICTRLAHFIAEALSQDFPTMQSICGQTARLFSTGYTAQNLSNSLLPTAPKRSKHCSLFLSGIMRQNFWAFRRKMKFCLPQKFEENSTNFSSAHCFSQRKCSGGSSCPPIIGLTFRAKIFSAGIFLRNFSRKFSLFIKFAVEFQLKELSQSKTRM